MRQIFSKRTILCSGWCGRKGAGPIDHVPSAISFTMYDAEVMIHQPIAAGDILAHFLAVRSFFVWCRGWLEGSRARGAPGVRVRIQFSYRRAVEVRGNFLLLFCLFVYCFQVVFSVASLTRFRSATDVCLLQLCRVLYPALFCLFHRYLFISTLCFDVH